MDLLSVIKEVKPDVLLGLTGVGGTFKVEHIRAMSESCERPIVMPCSNPTSKSECTAEQVYDWSDGRALFASGSPFEEFFRKGKKIVPSQGNNMYIFPGLG